MFDLQLKITLQMRGPSRGCFLFAIDEELTVSSSELLYHL